MELATNDVTAFKLCLRSNVIFTHMKELSCVWLKVNVLSPKFGHMHGIAVYLAVVMSAWIKR